MYQINWQQGLSLSNKEGHSFTAAVAYAMQIVNTIMIELMPTIQTKVVLTDSVLVNTILQHQMRGTELLRTLIKVYAIVRPIRNGVADIDDDISRIFTNPDSYTTMENIMSTVASMLGGDNEEEERDVTTRTIPNLSLWTIATGSKQMLTKRWYVQLSMQ
jgi:hypothetical protein